MIATTPHTTDNTVDASFPLALPEASKEQTLGEGASTLQMQLSVILKDKVCAAKTLMQRRRGVYWSFTGRNADKPMSPDAAQSAFAESVQMAIDDYFQGVRNALN